ncbi:MAG: hypothetical protein H0X42_09330 [Solirubrobacterales bacterium]|nr:hypothetical protein [Solirubrobacterales bacterium]
MCGLGLFALVLLVLGGPIRAEAAGFLAKPAARAVAAAKADEFAAAHRWAETSRIGHCERRSPVRFACAGAIRGKRRICAVSVGVSGGSGAPATRLRRGRCHAIATPRGTMTGLAAHISPNPARDLGNPFRVTYSYGASAISEVPGDPSSAKAAPLPPGTLSLYSDGLLECSVGVTQAAPEWTCPVEYLALGSHHLTATYTAGSQAASAALLDDVGRLGTSFSLGAAYEPLRAAKLFYRPEACEEAQPCEFEAGTVPEVEFEIGTLEVSAGAVSPWGNALPKSACPEGDPTCAEFELEPDATESIEVFVIADLVVNQNQVVEEGDPLDAEMLAPQSVILAGILSGLTVAELEDGTYRFQASSGPRPGYAESEMSAPIHFTPAALDQVRYH